MVGRIGDNTFSSWEWVSRYTVKKYTRFGQHTFLDYLLGFSLGLYWNFSIADLGGEEQMVVLTSRRVWIPLEFCADCNALSD